MVDLISLNNKNITMVRWILCVNKPLW